MPGIVSIIWDLLYPKDCVCLVCGATLHHEEHVMCAACVNGVKTISGARCRACSRPLNDDRDITGLCSGCVHLPYEKLLYGRAPFVHSGTSMQLVHALKYDHIRDAAESLALAMSYETPSGYDAFVPVPLHVKRERARGYNQSRVLCEHLSNITGLPTLDALIRSRVTSQQMKLRAKDREGNVADAFRLVAPVDGMRLILVDDVRTTGMTALSCAKTLFRGGALDVMLLTATLAMVGDRT